jgi:60 kDa SS-A/Ro ribonucleoprotein
MADALEQIRTRGAVTPQARQADPRQELNHAGGYVFTTDSETRLRRFLTMGTYGTYYVNEQDTTAEMAPFLLGWARDNATRLTELATEISVAGRAPRQGPALLALMAAMALGDVDGRRAAERAFNDVVRTGTHLFGAAKYTEQFRGWGPVARRAFAGWYLDKDPAALAYQLVKYRQRDGWTHLDVLRSAHSTKHADQPHRDLFNWLAKGVTEQGELPAMVQAHEMARDIERQSGSALARRAKTAAYTQLLRDHPGLPWEALPDEATSQGDVWRVLIDNGMPVTALIRNLPKLTRLGVLAPMSSHLAAVCGRLRDGELLRKGRVHPIALLVAAKVYASGRSEKGSTTWVPVPQVLDALNDAFYLAFGAVEPSGKRTMISLDISGSMGSSAAGYCLSAREAVAAMALVTMSSEPAWGVYGFSTSLMPLQLSPGMRLDQAMRYMTGLPFGGTDCSLPMVWALQNRVEVDTFQIFGDYETWAGGIHPHQALENYRQGMGISARVQTVMTTPTRFALADPDDPASLDVSGFDASVPVLLADHARGDI